MKKEKDIKLKYHPFMAAQLKVRQTQLATTQPLWTESP